MRRIISLYLLLMCAMALPVFSQNLVDEALGDSSAVAEVNDFVLPDSLLFLSKRFASLLDKCIVYAVGF